MTVPPDSDNLFQPVNGAFLTTRWSLVVRAGESDEKTAQQAMAELCRDYWKPLFAYARRRGLSPEDAADLTQGFFLHAIDGDLIQRARAERGRFRSYLLTAMQQFFSNERRRAQTQKRGGDALTVSMDEMLEADHFPNEPADTQTPEAAFDRSWAFALLDRVFVQLGEDYAKAGRMELFEKLRPYLAGKTDLPSYETVGAELNMSAGAVGVAIHRMRKRYGELLREEVAHTVAEPDQIDSELQQLLAIVAGA
ncbi:MAG: sigma-70 family RNA polymerase sigma factor [Verrucomicrobiaceae bacterium]|nr:sigma-70 family RNA polymerase sigma factor [Verrucomicrobiaceae bacterium]